ncbi:MAG: gliding motility protein GldL [Prevotella sp.]|nr:gliding motility protein GldL [Prevotella sp.]
MTQYSKFNIIYRLQKWLDSVPGQTFMNYAYSWGASIVILGALFKLTHLPGANFMLFLGMGTEVLVFFIAGFDRPFDKTEDGKDLPTHVADDEPDEQPLTIAGGAGGTIVIGGGRSTAAMPQSTGQESGGAEGGTVVGDGGVVGGSGVGGGGGVIGGVANMPELPELDAEGMEEATTNYVEQLRNLSETLQKATEQIGRITHDSEEMENLNRTLTGISRVYEMQLKGASQQIGTIDQINEQNRRLADQIAELNQIYARMIEAMTTNMPPRP